MQTITLEGTTGSAYEFEIYPMSMFGSFDHLEHVEAVYVFARQKSNKKFRAVYIGETKNVDDRLDEDHHQIDCIREKKRPTSSSIGTKKTLCWRKPITGASLRMT